jgi:hypothetical protein
MKSLKFSLALTLLMAAFLFAGTAAKGQGLNFSNTSPTFVTVAPGATVTFSGTLTANPVSTEVFINGDGATGQFVLPPQTPDPNVTYLSDEEFNSTVPLFMGGNNPSNFTGPLFSVTLPLNYPLGDYSSVFFITGGADESAQDTLVSIPFEIVVAEPVGVPEGGASAIYLLLAGGVCFGAMAVRRRKAIRVSAST